jgi:hypothetical protein
VFGLRLLLDHRLPLHRNQRLSPRRRSVISPKPCSVRRFKLYSKLRIGSLERPTLPG